MANMIKKSITTAALLATASTLAHNHSGKMFKMEAPTVYGKLNKVYAYTDQEDVHGRKTTDGVTDVSNSESRIGVKGKGEVFHMKTSYKLELGINSTKNDDTNDFRVRVRESVLKLKSKYGKLMFGQTYAVVTKQGRRSDPLQETIAGHQGEDMKLRVENAVADLGFNDRSRADLVGYVSPSLHGFTYSVSQDKGNGFSNKVSDSNYGQETTEHLLRYEREMGNVALDLYTGLQKVNRGKEVDEETMTYGFNIGFNAFTLGFAMSTEEYDSNDNTTADEKERMFAALSYERSNNKYSFTYQTREDSTDSAAQTEYSQMALNWAHKCNKWTTFNLTGVMYEVENKSGLTGATKEAAENEATIVAAGIQLKF